MFQFDPAPFVPYKNKEILEKCRNIKREDMEKHPNPNFRIHIVPSCEGIWVGDMVTRIMRSDILNEKCVMILPNPCPTIYLAVAESINKLNINCRNLHIFMMDEWADADGNIAPLDYKAGFAHSNMTYFYMAIREDLRPPLSQVHYPTNENVNCYSDMIEECGDGGADICYSGPGWTGHIAFIDPCTPEFGCPPIEEYLNMSARIVTLNPMTVMQNSLHGCFGCSGDIANVPPKAFTIGPRDVKNSKNRLEMHDLTTMGTYSSWIRMTSRLILYGEVTPLVPSSMLQLMDTDVYVTEAIAAPFGCEELVGY